MFALRIYWQKILLSRSLSFFHYYNANLWLEQQPNYKSQLTFCVGDTTPNVDWRWWGAINCSTYMTTSMPNSIQNYSPFDTGNLGEKDYHSLEPDIKSGHTFQNSLGLVFRREMAQGTAEILAICITSRQTTLLSFCKQPCNSQEAAT